MGASGVGETLERLGAMRFRQKAAAWRRRLAAGLGLEEALWSGLLEALAYGGGREAFRRLASELPWEALRERLLTTDDTDEPQMGADGDGDEPQIGVDWPQITGAGALVLLRRALDGLGVAPARTPRPGNGAEKRLAGAAALAARFAGPGLSASLIGPLAEPESAAKLIVDALTVPRLVGRARAIEIAVNAVLPLAAALCGEPAASRIEAVFAGLPLPARYGAVRHLHEVARPDVRPSHLHEVARPDVRPNMRRQQGMLYLLGQYCTQGGCGKCPLS